MSLFVVIFLFKEGIQRKSIIIINKRQSIPPIEKKIRYTGSSIYSVITELFDEL